MPLDTDQLINIEQFTRLLPLHKGALTIEHNEHKNCYLTVAEFTEDLKVEESDWLSPEDRQKSLDTGELWMVRWYPDTPVGSFWVWGSTLSACLQKIRGVDWS